MSHTVKKSVKSFQVSYDTPGRFVSYFTQADWVLTQSPETVLEIGVGNRMVSDYLIRRGIAVTTCDLLDYLEPDVVADVRDLPLEDNTFDLVMACQVLEHLEWGDVSIALKEMARVSRKDVLISVPHTGYYLESIFHSSLFHRLFRRSTVRFLIQIPFALTRRINKYHQWEIGYWNYPLRKVRRLLRESFEIKKECRPPLNPWHHFFLLEKR